LLGHRIPNNFLIEIQRFCTIRERIYSASTHTFRHSRRLVAHAHRLVGITSNPLDEAGQNLTLHIHSFINICHQSMKVVETLLVLRLVMPHKKMSLVQLVDVLFSTSTLLSVVVTDFFEELRVSPTVEIIILNLGIGFKGDECILELLEVFGGGESVHIYRESDGIVGRLVTDDEAVFLEINSVMGNRVENSMITPHVVTDSFDVLSVGAVVCKLKRCGSDPFLDPLRTLSGLSGHAMFCCCGWVNGEFCRVVREVLMAVPGA
jgi:hypothetical protein